VSSFLPIDNDDDDYDTVTTTAVPPVTLAPEIRVAEEKLRYCCLIVEEFTRLLWNLTDHYTVYKMPSIIPIMNHTSGYSITCHQLCTIEGTLLNIVVLFVIGRK
jgi:hypothetical protein